MILTVMSLLTQPTLYVGATNNDVPDTIKDVLLFDIRHINSFPFRQPPQPTPTPTPQPTPPPIGEQAVNTARQYLGVPYVWGGTTPRGFDCSGLVQYVYKQLGINISRTSYTQVNDGRAVAKDELKAGDLIFFANSKGVHHVGIYIGDGQFIHAPQTGDVVKIANLSDRKDFYTARRIAE